MLLQVPCVQRQFSVKKTVFVLFFFQMKKFKHLNENNRHISFLYYSIKKDMVDVTERKKRYLQHAGCQFAGSDEINTEIN